MSFLAVDVGNTDIKLGVFEGDTLNSFHRLPTDHDSLAGAFEILLKQLPSLERLALCSVVPSVTPILQDVFRACYPQATVCLMTPTHSLNGIHLGGYPVSQLGADRWVNLSFAKLRYPHQHVLMLTCGTATTLDALDNQGRFMGGLITPGLKSFSSILTTKTAQLFDIPLQRPEKLLGHNTQACLQAGIVEGYRALITGLFSQIYQETGVFNWITITTGGLAAQVVELSGLSVNVMDPTWTLHGLYHLDKTQEGQLC